MKSLFPRSTQCPAKSIAVLFAVFGLSLSAAYGQLKIATVKMNTLLNEFHQTKAAEQEDQVQRADIKKDDAERVAGIKAMAEELKNLQAEFNDSSLSDKKRKEIAVTARDRQGRFAALQKEREEFLQRRNRALNQKMIALMDEIRVKVMTAVNAHAAKNNFDYVFDDSGLTSSQVPFLLYVRNKVDITDKVLAELNKDVPKTEPATPEKEKK